LADSWAVLAAGRISVISATGCLSLSRVGQKEEF
jgi:hypothetical protein